MTCIPNIERTLRTQQKRQITQGKIRKGSAYFFKEDIQMASKHVKKILDIISHQGNVKKITIVTSLPVGCQEKKKEKGRKKERKPKQNKTKTQLMTSIGEDVETLGPSHRDGGNAKC